MKLVEDGSSRRGGKRMEDVAHAWEYMQVATCMCVGRTATVRVAPCGRTQAALADASQPPRMLPLRVGEFRLSKVTELDDTMNSQAKLMNRTPSSLSHAFSTRVVRELPSLASVAHGSAQTW